MPKHVVKPLHLIQIPSQSVSITDYANQFLTAVHYKASLTIQSPEIAVMPVKPSSQLLLTPLLLIPQLQMSAAQNSLTAALMVMNKIPLH